MSPIFNGAKLERLLYTQKVGGSTTPSSTRIKFEALNPNF